ncbi:MAG: tetratricopeptide repeat protein, partial [Gammaproteobacteria bacterium]
MPGVTQSGARVVRVQAAAMALLLVAVAVPWPGCAAPLDAVQTAVRQHDYARAAKLLQGPAAAGNPEAQYQLAALYRAGRGVPRDYDKAFHWLSEAAHQGYVKAEYSLGVMYENGWGTAPDRDRAIT